MVAEGRLQVTVEPSAVASGKKATVAVLFSDTSELSWATGREQRATESWDLLGPQSCLSGVS